MKIKLVFLAFCFALLSFGAHAASGFEQAARLLSAARAGDTRTVDTLVRSGADVNFVDNTGLSIVCTAIMNNDMRAAQILQAYGADSSRCDQQIKRYKQSQKPKLDSDSGFFSGLSTPQNMILMVGGAALVVAGVVWLASSSSSSNNNPGSGNNGGGGHGGGGGGGGGGTLDTAWAPGALPQGPSLNTFNPDLFSEPTNLPYGNDFVYMSNGANLNGVNQNYLLLMYGYAPLARGYLGQSTLRKTNKAPYTSAELEALFSGLNITGGVPVNVALVTNNGINPTGSANDGLIFYATCLTSDPSCTASTHKYFNLNSGIENPIFDFSGHGTVFNSDATTYESSLAKIIAGWEYGGRANGDYYGFVPNGQLTVFRTGGGLFFTADASPSVVGNADGSTFETITTVTVGGVPYSVVYDPTTKTFTVSGPYGFTGYVGNDGLLYVDMGGGVTNVYLLNGSDEIMTVGQLTPQDYLNFQAMLAAANLGGVGNRQVSVVANAALVPTLRRIDAATISDALVLTSAGTSLLNQQQIFLSLINNYYNVDTTDASNPGVDAGNLFNGMGNFWSPMLIFSTGEFSWGLGEGKSLSILEATFENLAPALFSNLNQMFMSVVAVQTQNGTAGVGSVSAFDSSGSPGKIVLSSHLGDDGNTYVSRACGMAGKGTAAVDPWCFAAAGGTAEQAVAAMAGAVAAIKGAFAYMSTKQIFTLLALTSDGTLLAPANTNGTPRTQAELIAYLDSKYVLPPEYAAKVLPDNSNYLDIFAQVYGYGLVDLYRATKPGTTIYYTSGTSIRGGQWRSASAGSAAITNIAFSPSAAFSQGLKISVPMFDTLESADGSMTLPRVFENNFATGGMRRGLYLGDVLGDFITDKSQSAEYKANGFSTSMKFSESNRQMNMNGLDSLSFGYDSGDWSFASSYQHHFEDANKAVLRGEGSNPVLSLASDAVTAGAKWGVHGWSFGARAFSGQITDETLVETDPAISNRYEPARLGLMQGAESSVGYSGEKFTMQTAVGTTRENNTVLGTYSDGLLGLGGGTTVYIDSIATFAPTDGLKLNARATFASTKTNPTGDVIVGLSDLQSNAFSVGAEFGGWTFNVSRPLAITSGNMRCATMNYEVVESDTGFDLITDPYIANLNLAPDTRETRFSMAYRTKFSENTSGAFGLVYRVNPDNTNEFGNESILMMKVRHTVGF
ncbi:MAG: hypothetical protein FWE50_04505 [Alphaproteobacteria bacterium]|nr:hypothetical protein [Alphaproteobacteria bacterium]